MKKFRLITALVLVLGLVVCLPFAVQAQEETFREIYLEKAYQVSDTQIVVEFSEPIKINQKAPWMDIRMTNQSGLIVGVYDSVGNQTGYYQWSIEAQYLNADHDKLIFTMTGEAYGCDTISELLAGNGIYSDDAKVNADIKEKIKNGTYRFLLGLEELYLTSPNEVLNDGMLKNICAEDDETVFVWPTRLDAGEAVHAWLDELEAMPAGLVVDEALFEGLSGIGQNWEFDVMALGTEKTEEALEDTITKIVKNDPVVIAIILSAGVVVAAVLIVTFVLASKKRKAA